MKEDTVGAMRVPRRRDTLESLQRRRDSWAREIGSNSEWSDLAPRTVRELDAEIAALRASVKEQNNGG